MGDKTQNLQKFEGFSLDTTKKILWRDGEIVPLPPKAVEILVVLIENAGEVVTKDDLLDQVWGEDFVEEANLTNNIYLLRKTIGELAGVKGLIKTVPRRGYRFIAKSPENGSELVLEHHVFEQTLIEKIPDSPEKKRKLLLNKFSSSPRLLVSLSFLLVVLLGVFAVWQFSRNSSETEIKSIAVLPLKPITANATDEDKILSLGLADALITKLAASQKIVVRPTSSITQYGEKDFDALEVGRGMRVDAVLDGSFQRVGDRLRVNVKLLRVYDGKQIWTGTFNETEIDIFKLQDAISNQAAESLALNLNKQQREAVLKRYTENVEAYQVYLRGRYLYHRLNDPPENLDKAIAEFEQALRLDANYTLAYSGLADALARKANGSVGSERVELYERAKINALKALALDDNLAETHIAIGWIYRIYDWNWTESERHMKRAIELAPNESRYYHLYAFLLITLGRTSEAVENARKAMELDPVEKTSAYAFTLSCDRQFDKSIAEYNKILGKSPDHSVWRGLANVYLYNNQPAEAIRIFNLAPARYQEGFGLQLVLPIAYYRLGENDKAEEILRELEQRARIKPEHSTDLAIIYNAIGRREESLAALQKALEIRNDRLMWIKTNPLFDNLRDDPRYQEVLRKMNLSD